MRPGHRVPQHAPLGRPRRTRVVVGAVAAIGSVALIAGLAFAYFVTTDSSHPAAASASSLAVPTATVSEDSATSARISWTAGAQPTGTQYVVVRNPGAGQVTVCTVPSSTTTCVDSGLSPGTTYSYAVTATLDAWQSAAGTGSFTTMAVTITSPGNGSTFGANWGGSVTGTSSAATGTVVSSVQVSIQQGSGSCWTGSGNAWTATCPNYVATTGTVGNWTLGLPIGDLNSTNTYHVTAQATDSAANTATSTATFTYSSAGPSPAAPVPSATVNYSASGIYWVNSETVGLTDVVTPGFGSVTGVAYYYCATSACTSSNGTLIGNGSGGTWSYSWPASSLPAPDGTYYVVAVATDSLSNVGTSSPTEIGVDRTPPNVSTPSVNGLS